MLMMSTEVGKAVRMADGTSVGSRLGSSTFRCLSLSEQMPAIIDGVEYPLTTGMLDYFDNVEMSGAFGTDLGPCPGGPDWIQFILIQSSRAMAEIPPVKGELSLPIRNDGPHERPTALTVSHWTANGPNAGEAIALASSFRRVDKPEGANPSDLHLHSPTPLLVRPPPIPILAFPPSLPSPIRPLPIARFSLPPCELSINSV